VPHGAAGAEVKDFPLPRAAAIAALRSYALLLTGNVADAEAAALHREACALQPTKALAFANLALALYALGQLDEGNAAVVTVARV
jgi:hypothetical protein